MKRKILGLILVLSVFVAGCNVNMNIDGINSGNLNSEDSAGGISDKTDNNAEETGSSKEDTEDSDGADTFEYNSSKIKYDDGSPWIDSDLKINIDNSDRPDEKDDFHFAVNYDWLKSADIKDGFTAESSFTVAEAATVERARKLLADDSLTGHDAELVHSMYEAIMDWDKRNKDGMDPVMPVLKDITGISSLNELSDFICDPVRSNCVNTFISIANEISLTDSHSYIAYINNDTLLLEDATEYADITSAGEQTYKAKKALATAMLVRLGMDEKLAMARFDRVMGFEEKLAEKSLTRADYSSPDIFEKVNNIYTEKEMESITKSFPLMNFIEGFGYGGARWYAIYQPDVLKKLDELYTEDNLDVMKDYMIIHYLLYAADKLDRECYDLNVEMMNTQYGTSGSMDDEEIAYNTILKLIPEPLEKIYLDKYDASEMKEDITGICRDIIARYSEMIKNEEWLSEDAKKMALLKLKNMNIKAVYPDEWKDYSTLDLEGLSYLECVRSVNRFDAELDRSRTDRTVDREQWSLNILQCNAFYNKQDNSINIVLGILDDAFYNEGMSKEEKLGGIGTVIGHEISHAFDETGAQFDEYGNLKGWWSGNDYKAYGEKTDKLTAYYDGIRGFNGTNEPGDNIKSEAIADMAAMKVILNMTGDEESFDYDKFFKQYARIWRCVMTPEAEYDKLTRDKHPLNYLRTNVTLQQFDEFYDTYGIQEGDGMYLAPEDRITVW
ncbi:MAG: M13 family metallopeptidase [Lachnospiraceae bacterium]|nr:M13 family metallopeptidase [Lachnospiraceae bacterium]